MNLMFEKVNCWLSELFFNEGIESDRDVLRVIEITYHVDHLCGHRHGHHLDVDYHGRLFCVDHRGHHLDDHDGHSHDPVDHLYHGDHNLQN